MMCSEASGRGTGDGRGGDIRDDDGGGCVVGKGLTTETNNYTPTTNNTTKKLLIMQLITPNYNCHHFNSCHHH